MNNRDRSIIIAFAAALLVVLAIVFGRRVRRPALAPAGVVDSSPERPAPAQGRSGTPADRGKAPVVGIDVDRLRGVDEFEPAVEYLTYTQMQRGETGEHLLFVRNEDLDAIAALEGADAMDFIQRLQQLGVIVSNN